MTPEMMIPVNAWIIQSKEEADNILLNGGKIVILTEDIPEYLNNPYFGTSSLMANCLLPNYEAVSYYIEGDTQNFSRSYNEMLSYPESSVYFITMISAMLNNIPLGFVFGSEEIEQAAQMEFLNHLAMQYGIHLGHNFQIGYEPPIPIGWMDRNYSGNNMCLLYMNNLLTPQEYLYVYPLELQITPVILQKLLIDLRPPIHNPNDFQEVEAYFDMLRKTIRNANRVLIDPMVMA